MPEAMTARAALDARMSEDELLSAVLEMARLTGWRVFHVRDSKRGVIQGPGCEGFPDLTMGHPGGGGEHGRIIYRELKTEKGRLTKAQADWGALLLRARCDWDVWRPHDLPDIERLLKGG